jgi:hypothetical protein
MHHVVGGNIHHKGGWLIQGTCQMADSKKTSMEMENSLRIYIKIDVRFISRYNFHWV